MTFLSRFLRGGATDVASSLLAWRAGHPSGKDVVVLVASSALAKLLASCLLFATNFYVASTLVALDAMSSSRRFLRSPIATRSPFC
jgi:hypothetical protein